MKTGADGQEKVCVNSEAVLSNFTAGFITLNHTLLN